MRTSKLASAASRAAATRSGRETVPNSGPTRMAARFSGAFRPGLEVAALGADVFAGPAGERGEGDAVLLVRLLDAGQLEVVEDHGGEVGRAGEGPWLLLGDLPPVNHVVVLVHGQDPVGREAFHGERAGNANLVLVLVWFVVELFRFGFRGNRGVDLLLPGDAGFPPRACNSFAASGQSFSAHGGFPILPGFWPCSTARGGV